MFNNALLFVFFYFFVAKSEVIRYEKHFLMSEPEAQNFQLVTEYPQECPDVDVCAAFANIKAKLAGTLIDFINGFIYNREEKTCKVGRIPNEDLIGKPANDPITNNEQGVHLRTGCYRKRAYDYEAVKETLDTTNLYFYYPGDGNDKAYYQSDMTEKTAGLGTFPQFGHTFFH